MACPCGRWRRTDRHRRAPATHSQLPFADMGTCRRCSHSAHARPHVHGGTNEGRHAGAHGFVHERVPARACAGTTWLRHVSANVVPGPVCRWALRRAGPRARAARGYCSTTAPAPAPAGVFCSPFFSSLQPRPQPRRSSFFRPVNHPPKTRQQQLPTIKIRKGRKSRKPRKN